MILRFLKGSYFLFVLWTLTLGIFPYLATVHLWTLLFHRDETTLAEHRVAILWGRLFIFLMPGWQYQVLGQENLPPPGTAVVVVANYQSGADILALFTLGIQFRWLSKFEVFKLPVIGQAMRWAGYVPVKRGNKASHIEAMEQSAAWLRRGVSMTFFPEGTRSLTGDLLPFKSGAFRLAEAENVAILPVVLCGTRDLMLKKAIVPNRAKIEIRILPAMRRLDAETLDTFIARTRDAITQNLVAYRESRRGATESSLGQSPQKKGGHSA